MRHNGEEGVEMRIRLVWSILALLTCLALPHSAFADATAFLGTTTTPSNRLARGFAGGVSLIIVGFEFEYANTVEDTEALAPSLTTGMGNVFVQTPTKVQIYVTTGGGFFRERLGTVQETNFGVNTGGGVKIPVLGPLRARFDYRVFNLRGTPLHKTAHRFYAGLNLAF
jgi:hypothetical protein